MIDTLTGFKWIAAKIGGYEEQLKAAMGPGWDYDRTPFAERARLLLKHSTFFVFGTEESYGYLPNDYVRDKDGNAACLMFSELCAWVAGQGLTVPEYLDQALPQVRVLPRGHDQHLLRGRERQRQDQAHPGHLPAAPRPRPSATSA